MTRSRDVANIDGILTTTGDTYYASAAATPARLGVGSTGQVLTVAGGVPTWATPATPAPTFTGVGLYTTSTLTIPNDAFTSILFDSEWFDTDAFHSTSTNTNRITIPSGKAGKYLFTANLSYQTNSTGTREIRVFKNNSVYAQFQSAPNTGSRPTTVTANFVVDVAVSDYFTISAYQTSGSSLVLTSGSQDTSFFMTYLGA